MQQQPAAGPMVTVGQEQFRDASTWETVVSNLTSSDAAYEVQGYGGERPPLYSHMHLLGPHTSLGMHGCPHRMLEISGSGA